MRADGMQAEDARTPLADGTLVKTPSAPMPPRRSQPRLRGSPSPADTCRVAPQSGQPRLRGSPSPADTSRVTPQSGQPRLRGGPASRPGGGFSTSCSYAPASTGVSTQRCRNSPSLSPVATVTADASHNLVRRHRNKNTRTHTLESQTNSSRTNKNGPIANALKSIHGSQPRGH